MSRNNVRWQALRIHGERRRLRSYLTYHHDARTHLALCQKRIDAASQNIWIRLLAETAKSFIPALLDNTIKLDKILH